ncbi:MAG: hypothetical protein HRU70_07100 [Phycisphaeraceae bacterium]|nr:MAG: hypothetical protein HRU70_07100 [Phycisphaeraceae bacterium]
MNTCCTPSSNSFPGTSNGSPVNTINPGPVQNFPFASAIPQGHFHGPSTSPYNAQAGYINAINGVVGQGVTGEAVAGVPFNTINPAFFAPTFNPYLNTFNPYAFNTQGFTPWQNATPFFGGSTFPSFNPNTIPFNTTLTNQFGTPFNAAWNTFGAQNSWYNPAFFGSTNTPFNAFNPFYNNAWVNTPTAFSPTFNTPTFNTPAFNGWQNPFGYGFNQPYGAIGGWNQFQGGFNPYTTPAFFNPYVSGSFVPSFGWNTPYFGGFTGQTGSWGNPVSTFDGGYARRVFGLAA